MRSLIVTFFALSMLPVGCTVTNEAHCGNRAKDQTCADRGDGRPFCSVCEASYDGCVASLDDIADACRPGGVADEGNESTSADTSDTGSTTNDTDSADTDETASTDGTDETDGDPVCGNGVKEGNEDCDGTDFGDLSCDDPYGLPEGELSCVPDECVVDTSTCCLQDGEVCQEGECCNNNCNLVTNKCGL